MSNIDPQTVYLVKLALSEDIGPGDITTVACLEPQSAQAVITAKSDGILSGSEPTALAFRTVDPATKVDFLISDGDKFSAGDRIAEIEGFNQTILTAERVALNFLGHLSGIATLTNLFVACLKGCETEILDTRKTTPGWRMLEKKAVGDGGGRNHRIGLYDMVLIKDNHIAGCKSVTTAVKKARAFLRSLDCQQQFNAGANEIEVEVEVTSLEQLTDAITAGADRLLLDNQSVDSMIEMVKTARRLNDKVKLEASGNVTLKSVAAIAATGVDFISAGAITHSAPGADFSLSLLDQPE